MIDIPFSERFLPAEQITLLANSLADKSFATRLMEDGLRKLQTGGKTWLPRLVLVAAQRLGRANEVLPLYETFLGWMDSQTKPDWHAAFSNAAPANDLAAQSGRLDLDEQVFQQEYQRVISSLAPLSDRPILDVGCAGGLWSIRLAKLGYDVIGTDHHGGIIEAARQNAKAVGLDHKLKFLVDETQDSNLPAEFHCSRVICISVTVCLPSDAAFESLISHLDRVSKPAGWEDTGRRVVLGHNRWGPSRMPAVREILITSPDRHADTVTRLHLIENTWWMHPRHIDSIRQRFPSVTKIGEWVHKIDGVRVDLLLE